MSKISPKHEITLRTVRYRNNRDIYSNKQNIARHEKVDPWNKFDFSGYPAESAVSFYPVVYRKSRNANSITYLHLRELNACQKFVSHCNFIFHVITRRNTTLHGTSFTSRLMGVPWPTRTLNFEIPRVPAARWNPAWMEKRRRREKFFQCIPFSATTSQLLCRLLFATMLPHIFIFASFERKLRRL